MPSLNLTAHRSNFRPYRVEPLEGRFLLAAIGEPELVADLNPGPDGSRFLAPLPSLGEHVVFTANKSLYRSDGTSAGTVPLRDSLSLIDQGRYSPSVGAAFRDLSIFPARPIVPSGEIQAAEFYRSDGTAAGTYPLAPSTQLSGPVGSGTQPFVVADERVYFIARDPVSILS